MAKDVCDILDISRVDSAVRELEDDEKGAHSMSTLGGTQNMTTINESGVYTLIFRSRKPQAKAFRKWVTSEVLPQLRKTGTYSTKPIAQVELLLESVKALVEQEKKLKEYEERLADVEHKVDAKATASEFFTVVGYCSYMGLPSPTLSQAAKIGKKLSKKAREIGLQTGSTPDPRFGRVKTYPKELFDEYFGRKHDLLF